MTLGEIAPTSDESTWRPMLEYCVSEFSSAWRAREPESHEQLGYELVDREGNTGILQHFVIFPQGGTGRIAMHAAINGGRLMVHRSGSGQVAWFDTQVTDDGIKLAHSTAPLLSKTFDTFMSGLIDEVRRAKQA